MILAVGNVKGGVGKTTLAINIAIARVLQGNEVLLADADDQGSAAEFTQIRTELTARTDYTAVRLRGNEVRSELRKLQTKFDDIIIDVGGRDTEGLRAALIVSNKILIPVLPSSIDIWAFDRIATLINEARELNPALVALAVLNAADASGKDNSAAREAMRDSPGIITLDIVIGRRKAFRNAAAQGASVLDMVPKDPKAIEELTAMVKAVFDD
jgi:chromosome partitioning protein